MQGNVIGARVVTTGGQCGQRWLLNCTSACCSHCQGRICQTCAQQSLIYSLLGPVERQIEYSTSFLTLSYLVRFCPVLSGYDALQAL